MNHPKSFKKCSVRCKILQDPTVFKPGTKLMISFLEKILRTKVVDWDFEEEIQPPAILAKNVSEITTICSFFCILAYRQPGSRRKKGDFLIQCSFTSNEMLIEISVEKMHSVVLEKSEFKARGKTRLLTIDGFLANNSGAKKCMENVCC